MKILLDEEIEMEAATSKTILQVDLKIVAKRRIMSTSAYVRTS